MNKIFQVASLQLESKPSPRKATVSLKIADAFVVTNLRIIEGSKGLFVTMPQSKGKEGDEDKYTDSAFPITKEGREEINALVLAAYHAKQQQPVKA